MRDIEIPQYPDDFYDFRDGNNVSDSTINKWIRECIKYLEENKNEYCSRRASGDTVVHITKQNYENDNSRYYYNISVCKGYSDADTYVINENKY